MPVWVGWATLLFSIALLILLLIMGDTLPAFHYVPAFADRDPAPVAWVRPDAAKGSVSLARTHEKRRLIRFGFLDSGRSPTREPFDGTVKAESRMVNKRRKRGKESMFTLPSEVEAVFNEFRTCELSTVAKDGTPLTWPITALFDPEQGRFLLTTSIGFPQKAFNIRRNPRVSLLFSNPTGSGLSHPPAVLVQGEARVSERFEVSPSRNEDLRKCWLHIMRFQPFSLMYKNDSFSHYLNDWKPSQMMLDSGGQHLPE